MYTGTVAPVDLFHIYSPVCPPEQQISRQLGHCLFMTSILAWQPQFPHRLQFQGIEYSSKSAARVLEIDLFADVLSYSITELLL